MMQSDYLELLFSNIFLYIFCIWVWRGIQYKEEEMEEWQEEEEEVTMGIMEVMGRGRASVIQ